MSQIYNWKRFWCTRAAQINLGDRGYLVDPESEYGHLLNPELVGLESIADLPCLILLGEPGVGKSQEMANLFKYTVEKIEPSHPPLELNLRSCNSLSTDLIHDRDFIDWINGSHRLYLFLDSLDEGMLTVGNLATQLVDEFNKNKYRDKLDRLYIRVACRTAVLPQILEQGLKKLWGENLAIYELAPLRYVDVENAATAENIEPQNFLSEVWDKTLVPLAIKPLTLSFLLNIYKRNGDKFSPDGTLCNLYLEGCRLLCEENNLSRQSANQKGTLEADERLIIAARIAAITVFANRFAIWTGTDRGEVPAEDVLLRQLILGNEVSNGRAVEVIREVLDTGLFSARGSQRMGWAHQTYAEFLAAWYLVQHQIPLIQIKELIFSAEDPERKLIPQLHETAAWLASMRDDVLTEIIKTDPDVLLRSDVSTDANIRSAIVDSLLILYEQEKLYDRNRDNYHQYGKLNYPGLADQLCPYIGDPTKQIDVRYLAIDIAEVCKVYELQEELVNLALDSSQVINLRVSAAKALCSIGNIDTRLKLKPLAVVDITEDREDRLKGYVLKAVWADILTAEELFRTLTRPKKINSFGSYRMFIDYELVPKLHPSDLVIALNWVEKQGVRCVGHPLLGLANKILVQAWENFDLPGVAESFTRVALIQWREYQGIIVNDGNPRQWTSLSYDTGKWHVVIEKLVLLIAEIEEDISYVFSFSSRNCLASEDFYWIIEKLQICECDKARKIWVQLLDWSFSHQDAKELNAIIADTHIHETLYRELPLYFEPIDLNSIYAQRLRADYFDVQKYKEHDQISPLNPSPQERILQYLDLLELDDLSAWFQLNVQMTLKPDSQSYGNEHELDLTKLPGWQEAEESTRRRIVEGAKRYIQQQNDLDYEWIGTNEYNLSTLGCCKAFQLLLKESSGFLETLLPETWRKWAPIIIATHHSHHESWYLEIVKFTYTNAPEESIDTLIKLIDGGDYMFLDCFDRCWDDRIQSALLKKIKEPECKLQCFEQLLEKLVQQGSIESRDFAKALISFPLPLDENERKKVISASRILVEDLDPSSWSFIWSLIQQDVSFGHEVLESGAYGYSHGIKSDLTEIQLADLYLWLVHQYPYEEDTDYSNCGAHNVTRRDCMGDLRNSTLSQLQEKGTSLACAKIQYFIQELPALSWLKKTLLVAQANMRRKTWQSPKPEQLLQLVFDREKRLVQSGEQLLDVLIESLDRLEIELQGETSAGRDIWDKNSGNSNSFRPIDENAFSDYVKRFLDRDLKSRGIIANREVELRRGSGGNPGERTDIHVDAVIQLPTGEIYDSITVIIEAKGCWHPELQTAMESQLVNRYLADNTCKYGLYLIGWFSCPQWDSKDLRNKKTPQMNIDEAKIHFDCQAEMLSTSGNVVRAYVMNTALR